MGAIAMEVSVTIKGTANQLKRVIDAADLENNGKAGATAAAPKAAKAAPAAEPKKRGRPPTKKVEEPEDDFSDDEADDDVEAAADDEDDFSDDEATDDDESSDDDDVPEDDEEPEEKPAKKAKAGASGKEPTKEAVVEAFRAYAKKHDRPKAVAVLKKMNVSSVNELKPSQYSLVMKMLK